MFNGCRSPARFGRGQPYKLLLLSGKFAAFRDPDLRATEEPLAGQIEAGEERIARRCAGKLGGFVDLSAYLPNGSNQFIGNGGHNSDIAGGIRGRGGARDRLAVGLLKS